MNHRELWVDFNSLSPDGLARTHVDFAEGDVVPRPGDTLTVGDADGNLAKAEVLEIDEEGLISLRVDLGSFQSSDSLAELSAT